MNLYARTLRKQTPVRVLVAESHPHTRMSLVFLLQRHRYHVTVANNGQDALDILTSPNPPQIVFLEWEMPRLDGFGLLEEMKRDPRLAKVPVIMVSSVENPDTQARGMALGADAYIVKRRFEQRELLETIRQIL